MMLVHVLHDPLYHRTNEGFLFPLYAHRRRLLERGIRLKFFNDVNPQLIECDVLCASSKFFSRWWAQRGGMEVVGFLLNAKKRAKRVVWFDHADSTGTPQFKVLPYVDAYCKNQVLRDVSTYQTVYYGSRVFTDFYHHQFGINDGHPDEEHLNQIPTQSELAKIIVGWNYGMAHYGYYGELLGKVWHRASLLPRWYPKQWYSPTATRSIPISCRIGGSYTRETVAYARKEIKRRLEGKAALERIARRDYFRELTQSIVGVSPFGYGEVCYRDFELTVAGATMLKQDMNHLDTWPNLWHEDTYLPFAWDLSDFDEKLEYALAHPKEMVERASAAQGIYRRILTTEEGYQEFCDRFAHIVSG